MEDLLNQLAANLLPFFVLFCIVPLVLAVIVLYFLWRRLNNIAAPDIDRLNTRFAELKAKKTSRSDSAVLYEIIRRQSMRSGIVGGLTSIGGFWTLPIALPIDIALSTQIQSTLVEFIARYYGYTSESQIERQIRTTLITSGSVRLRESGTRILLRYATRFLGKSFAKLIPFIGAAIGFAVNYGITNATAEAAIRYYSTKS